MLKQCCTNRRKRQLSVDTTHIYDLKEKILASGIYAANLYTAEAAHGTRH